MKKRPMMPGNFRPVPNRLAGPQVVAPPLDHITIDTFTVGRDGIVSSDPAYTPPTVSLDALRKSKRLGQGKEAVVFKYEDREPDEKGHKRKFAVKEIKLPSDGDQNRNVIGDLRAALGQHITNTITLENAYVRDGKLLLIMEYMNFGSLGELLTHEGRLRREAPPAQGRPPGMPEAAAAHVVRSVLAALNELHSPTASAVEAQAKAATGPRRAQIHRDIKPDNVLMARDGTVKLADFGVATSADSIGACTFIGTATYMSPERIKGERHGPPSDVWSVGIVAAEMLLGEFPFPAASQGLFQLLDEIQRRRLTLPRDAFTEEAQQFLDACLHQDPRQRLSAHHLLELPWIQRHTSDGQRSLRDVLDRHHSRRPPTAVQAPAAKGPLGEASVASSPPPPQTATLGSSP